MKDIQGVNRGKCNLCDCIEYMSPTESGHLRCEYCNHTPAEHVKIVELGACKRCGQGDCTKYESEDPNSYSECQYCGCSASAHEGAEVLRKPQPPQGGFPGHSSRTIPVQSIAQGNCIFPGCQRQKYVESGGRVHDYCGKTCARKHSELLAAQQKQKGTAAYTSSHTSDHQASSRKVLVHAQKKTVVLSQPGKPSQSATVTTVTTASVNGQPDPMDDSGLDMVAIGQSAQTCKKCGARPANKGYELCQQCYANNTSS